ncbi:cytochrome P450 [Hymenopellis radicata]|nr:cytochrome P450 [Hymenopellis radicata]
MSPLQIVLAVLAFLGAGNALKAWYLAHRVEQRLKATCPGGNKIWIFPLGALQLLAGTFYPFRGTVGDYFGNVREYGSTCLSCASVWGARPTYFITDAEAAKKICSDRHTFIKDVAAYEMLNIYGPNVYALAYSSCPIQLTRRDKANNALVWKESIRLIEEWFSDIDSRKDPEKPIDLSVELSQLTLLVISSTGFGRRGTWKAFDEPPPPSEVMDFHTAVTKAMSRLVYKVLTPKIVDTISNTFYIPFLTPLLKETKAAYDALQYHMLDVIAGARTWVADGKKADMEAALLRNLVEANSMSFAETLTDDEFLSNTLAFLLAGQETTAHTASFTLSILALYPEIQEGILKEVNSVWPREGPPPTYKDYLTKFEYTTATFMETLRLLPAVPRFGKLVQKDTVITGHKFQLSPDGKTVDHAEPFAIPIEKGTILMVDVSGLHINPMYWGPDAEEFRPEHFIDTDTYRWPRDAFLGFSGGPRTCLGQRFATTEAVCILASIVRKYEILVPPNLRQKSFEEQKRIMLNWHPGITSVPTGAKTVFRLRK